ncbi:hypothetical protein SAMN06265220_105102 [Flavobacterium nitrogenifigens]|uniref:YD repeat-containing protein n=2 Tax=Flavobacterium nitrogenifigens TaxID=1617283 RepID=A0A521EU69_9FLAO|nr:hypothetical protein SAMN06265220_105102 [Flavobacterium nitrogenifigens]
MLLAFLLLKSITNLSIMKKQLWLFGVLALLLTACSSDEKSSSEEIDSTLPKNISYIYPSPELGTNSKTTASYNGNKIVSLLKDDSKTVFTYDGDVIVKQEEFDIENGKEIKNEEVSYSYENGKLKTRVFRERISAEYPDGYFIEKVVYTHNSNGTVSYINYTVDNVKKTESKDGEGTLTYKDGNLIKEEQKSGSSTATLVFEYDSKKNPLKNILGFNLLLNEIDGFGTNNIVKTTRTTTEFPNPSVYLTTYIYNEASYPTRHTSFDGGGKNIEYEIEYAY